MIKIPRHFKKFLIEENFKLTNGKLFGRVDIYSSEILILRLVKDYNSFKSVEIARVEGPDEWIDLSVLRSHVLSNDDCFYPLDFEVGLNFFMENYNEILTLLSSVNYGLTLTRLHELKVKRAIFRKW